MKHYDVIVVGGGVAGMCAAERSANHGLSTLLLEGLYTGGRAVKVKKVEDYPGFPEGISGEALTDLMEKAVLASDAKILHEKVESFDLEGDLKYIYTNKDEYSAKAVILALGMRLREMGLHNERSLSKMGVFHSAKEESDHVRGKIAAVFGQGNVAAKEALALAEKASEIYLICPATEVGASKKYMDAIRKEPKITVILKTLIAEMEEDLFCLSNITILHRETTEFRRIPCHAVFVAPTPEPDSDVLLGTVRMTDDGAVITDEKMHTSIEGVFAAGAVREGNNYTALASASEGQKAADAANNYIERKPSFII